DSSQLELGLRIAYQREPSIRHSSSQYTFTSRLRYTTGHLRRETRTLWSLPGRRGQRRVRRPEREFHRNLCASEIAAATGRAVILTLSVRHSGRAAATARAGIHNHPQRLWIPGLRAHAPHPAPG